MTESEFLDPPWATQCKIWETLQDLSLTAAALPGSWARICLHSVECGTRTPSSFAIGASSSKDTNGLVRIQTALINSRGKEIDSCVRRIFRVMGGILCDRGYRTTFLDCPLAKSWWRHQIALNAAIELGTNDCVRAYSEVLRNSSVWEPILEHMISRQTVVAFPKVRAAVIDELVRINDCGESITKKRTTELLIVAGRICSRAALDLLDIDSVIHAIFGRSRWTPRQRNS